MLLSILLVGINWTITPNLEDKQWTMNDHNTWWVMTPSTTHKKQTITPNILKIKINFPRHPKQIKQPTKKKETNQNLNKKILTKTIISCVLYYKIRSSKSLLANVLDIDDDFRCNHRCASSTLPHQPTYYRTVYR